MPDCGCKEAFQRLDDYLDRELTAEEMDMVRTHLEKCQMCASEFQFESSVISVLKEKLEHLDMPCELLSRVMSALDRA